VGEYGSFPERNQQFKELEQGQRVHGTQTGEGDAGRDPLQLQEHQEGVKSALRLQRWDDYLPVRYFWFHLIGLFDFMTSISANINISA
jgi:hypothetical protein